MSPVDLLARVLGAAGLSAYWQTTHPPPAPRTVAAWTTRPPLTDLIGELVTRSDEFRYRWSAHDVRFHRSGTKRIRHPDVGDLEFAYEGLELPDSPGLVLYAYTTIASSPTEERLQLLGSLAATDAAPLREHRHGG